ncbi:MAG: hypothetical protein NZ893_00550 [Candidatus Aenigmarchaeota archaeon]|nr:hypothetical protein [Candidatus Aenigmarchaeota archaeon]
MKGTNRAIITALMFIIVIMLFLVLAFTIFKEKTGELGEVVKNLFKQALKGL